jgi:phosphatidylserine/phosphatidylglycerophosphate/cardiolipin synthase-like enzyme
MIAKKIWQGTSLFFVFSVAQEPAQIQVFFSPGGSPTSAIVETLKGAKKSIHAQAYNFTSSPIANALRQAHKRGVKAEVILDKSQIENKTYSVATYLRRADITVYIDSEHAIAHNKVMIIDDLIVITGSFNFTRAAETVNAENLLIIRDAGLAREYLKNWERCKAHSVLMPNTRIF